MEATLLKETDLKDSTVLDAGRKITKGRQAGRLTQEEASHAAGLMNRVIMNVEQEIVGKTGAIRLVLLALIAQGHVLLEDVPGVGKTSLVSAISRSIDCDFKRIQFTPDLMPSDVTGFSIYNQKTGRFEFRKGAVMSNLVLADEINRASAKTQAALLEAMEEKQVTIDSKTYTLDAPFMVMATQNPVESYGTYPLPEAQIDRFLIKLKMGYPQIEEEQQIIHMRAAKPVELSAVVSKEDINWLSSIASRVYVSEDIERYIVELVSASRSHPKVLLGSSLRGAIALSKTAKVLALFDGRSYVVPEDIKFMAGYVLTHRLILTHEAKVDKIDPSMVVQEILNSVVTPV